MYTREELSDNFPKGEGPERLHCRGEERNRVGEQENTISEPEGERHLQATHLQSGL